LFKHKKVEIKNIKMRIELSKQQFINLLEMSCIANSVLGILGDVLPEDTGYKKKSDEMEELEDYLISYAEDFGCGDMIEEFYGKILLKEEIYEYIQEIMDEYDDYIFWDELEIRMGKRDFERTITEEDEIYIKENNGFYPERINEIYEKYRKEFENYGIDRLEIKE
jgi:hypothetical protein